MFQDFHTKGKFVRSLKANLFGIITKKGTVEIEDFQPSSIKIFTASQYVEAPSKTNSKIIKVITIHQEILHGFYISPRVRVKFLVQITRASW